MDVEMYGRGGDDRLVGTLHGDFLSGGAGDDHIQGRAGDDTLDGGPDNDTLYGDYGSDILIGGPGNDTLDEQFVDDGPILAGLLTLPDRSLEVNTLDGNDGDDRLYGSPAGDTMDGGLGRDQMFGYGGNDVMRGGPETFAASYDRLLEGDVMDGGTGQDIMHGGIGDDIVSGGDGNDEMLDGGADDDRLRGGIGNDILYGRAGSDLLEGDDDDDELYGGLDGDILRGGPGFDLLVGAFESDFEGVGDGNDALYGGADDDVLYGGRSGVGLPGGPTDTPLEFDYLAGGSGNDRLFGGPGPDRLHGGSGYDEIEGNDGDDILNAGSGGDLPDETYSDHLLGGQGIDELYGSSNKTKTKGSYLDGGDDDDLIGGVDGPDLIFGGYGSDTINAGGGNDLVFGHLQNAIHDDGAIDTIDAGEGNDEVRPGKGDDIVHGGPGHDLLYGGDGDDEIYGEAGNDQIFGEDGDDAIDGGDDADLIYGGKGGDTIEGGSGPDRIEAGDGDDIVTGGDDNDLLLGQRGNDILDGGAGDDHVDGGEGVDVIRGGANDDFLVAGSGVGNQLLGGDGNDTITGSSEGAATDPDFFDAVFFGDVIDAGPGNDTVYGLGGADLIRGGDDDDHIESGSGSDYVLAGDGHDWVFVGYDLGETVYGGAGDDTIYGSHAGSDNLFGEGGNDRLFGQGGNDTLRGGDDDDVLDGGAGTDDLDGQQGNDELHGGGGVGDQLRGGQGNDTIYGSDDGADFIYGGVGRDTVFAGGGNDQVFGDQGNDILHGGPGDDLIAGGAGSDLIRGGADHDVLYGHSIGDVTDDNAVDYLYGDFATNADEVGSGRDQLHGGGGNDQLFGEGNDDWISSGLGVDDRVDYGTGESIVPADFVVPTPTSNPALTAPGPAIQTNETLPTGVTYRGRWTEFAGSASGDGLSVHPAGGIEPSVIVGADGAKYVAWVDLRQGNHEVYVARHSEVNGWESLGGSANRGGVSNSLTASRGPSLAIDASGDIVVAWTELTESGSDIHVAKFDAAGGQWTNVGSSGKVTSGATAEHAQLINSPAGLVLAWVDHSTGIANGYLRRFDGTSWTGIGSSDVGGGVTDSVNGIRNLNIAVTTGKIAMAWTEPNAVATRVFVKEYAGAMWQTVGASSINSGIGLAIDSDNPLTAAYHNGSLMMAWVEPVHGGEFAGPKINVSKFDGTDWLNVTPSSITAASAVSGSPRLASGGNSLYLAWTGRSISRPSLGILDTPIYVARWNGTKFVEMLDGDAGANGIHAAPAAPTQLRLTVDSGGRPYVAWEQSVSGQPSRIFLRGDVDTTLLSGQLHLADGNPGQSITEILATHDLGPGDTILITADLEENISIEPGDAGVALIAAPGHALTGSVSITATDVLIQNVTIEGSLTATMADRLTIRDAKVGAIEISGGSDTQISQVRAAHLTINNAAANTVIENNLLTGLTLGNASDATVRFNKIIGDSGLQIASPSSGSIVGNQVSEALIALSLSASFDGPINGNSITDNQVGVQYSAAATLSGNRISGNQVGVVADIADPQFAFGFFGLTQPNTISNNSIGVELDGRMRGQIVSDNDIGVSGIGILGGDTFGFANKITGNQIGVQMEGEVRYNRIGLNDIGIAAQPGVQIAHNEVYRNTLAGIQIDAADDVQVVGNTLYAPAGDNVRVTGGSRRVEIQNNVMWAESGYDIFVDVDSRVGFFSDYNVLHASDSGTLVHYLKDFDDILDWQEDVHQFDLHSIGTTDVNPNWSEPRFVSQLDDDYRVFELVGGQRFSSPTIAAGNPIIDMGRSITAADQNDPASAYVAINLLSNPSFESGLAGWNSNASASVSSSLPGAFDGGSYFAAGATVVGSVNQTIDLVAAGADLADVDAGVLRVRFGGRVQSLNEPNVDRGVIELVMLGASGNTLQTTTVKATNVTDRWELVGQDLALVPGTRSLRYTFTSTRAHGSSSDAFLDNAFVRLNHLSYAVDAGAFVISPVEQDRNASPSMAIRFPDLYTDWERDQPRTIRWDSLNNAADVPVRIDLYQDSADGPTFVKNIVDATPDDGQYIWTPADSDVDFGTHGLIIQVSRTDNQAVFDRSVETFSVPENTTTYFVNDGQQSNDQYTTAIGDNRNTGRTADAPKPYPTNVLRTYSLGPNDVLYNDAGDYQLLSPIVLSGTVGIGDDEGFAITGPDAVGSEAVLSFLLPNTDSAIIRLDDADLISISHLSLVNARHGIHADNGSTGIVLSNLDVTGHSDDGILFDGGSLLASGADLTIIDNAGNGFRSTSSVGSLTNIVANSNSLSGIETGGATGAIQDVVVTNNLGHGLIINGSATVVQNVAATSNRYDGIRLSGSGGPLIESNVVTSSGQSGIVVSGGGGATIRDNQVSSNDGYGIAASGTHVVSGNTVWQNLGAYGISIDGGSAIGNVVHGNSNGIYVRSGTVSGNRVYDNAQVGLATYRSADLTGNVVYSNAIGISTGGYALVSDTLSLRNNLIYDHSDVGIQINEGDGVTIANNTVYETVADGIELIGEGQNNRLLNNIVVVDSGTAVAVDKLGQPGFQSDFNLLRHGGLGQIGRWGTRNLSDLPAWRLASFGDARSLSLDPLFVDVDGADDSLGYVSPTNDGRDDDFHVSSSVGRFTGSLAPVISSVTGLPEPLVVTSQVDAVQSPAIDRGDPTSAFVNEPDTNGGYVNLGAFGNTAQASKSPAEFLVVVKPNGNESFPAERNVQITWRAAEVGGTMDGMVNVDLIRDSDAGYVLPLVTAQMVGGSFDWQVPTSVSAGTDYRIRLTRSDVAGLGDESDEPFEITEAISIYYVNDGVDDADQYTVAAGDDANDGLSPATPKASLRAVLDSGVLQPGDTILIDNGTYAVDTNLALDQSVSGITIQGPTADGSDAILDRENKASGHLFVFNGADDLTIANLSLTGAYGAVYSNLSVDSDRIVIRGNRIYDVQTAAIAVHSGYPYTLDEWLVSENTIYDVGIGVQIDRSDVEVRGNTIFDTQTGIHLTGDAKLLEAIDNTVYSSGTGFFVQSNAVARGNVVHGNDVGLSVYNVNTGAQFTPIADSNVVYNNDIGILLQARGRFDHRADATGNQVFDNRIGIVAGSYNGSANEGYKGTISSNLIYGNEAIGIIIGNAQPQTSVFGNTVQQSAADAIRVRGESRGIDFRNNLFSIDDGHVFAFDAASEAGHTSDFNGFDLGANGQLATFASGDLSTLSDWQIEIGLDTNSYAANPGFFDIDGPDDIFGFDDTGLDNPIFLDNGDPGFSIEGQWNSLAGGYQGTASAANSDDDIAVWSFSGLAAGTYSVATTVPYGFFGQADLVVFVSDTITQRRTVSQLNRSLDSFDFQEVGFGWDRLGDVVIGSDGELRVEMSGEALSNRWYVADAVRIQRIAGLGHADDDFHVQLGAPSIDAGDPSFDVADEPSPNGSRINVGAYGGTDQATVSAATEVLHVLAPNGSKMYSAGRELSVRWLSEVDSPVDIALYDADGFIPGVSLPWMTVATGEANDGQFDWLIPDDGSVPVDAEYIIGVTSTGGTMPSGLSPRSFTIANAGSAYYINDGVLDGDDYAMVAGDNQNIGKSPDQPMASLAAVMKAYDLIPGDIIYVDAGNYPLMQNIRLGDAMAGVTIQGPTNGSMALFDRQSTSVNAAVFELTGGDDLTIANLAMTGGSGGILAAADADRIEIRDNAIFGNESFGISTYNFSGTFFLNDWTIERNHIYGNSGSGMVLRGLDGHVDSNTIFGNTSAGINAGVDGRFQTALVISNNHIWGSQAGIFSYDSVEVMGNTVHSNDTGIYVESSQYGGSPISKIQSNIVYDNGIGIALRGRARFGRAANAIGNRVFDNQIGIQAAAYTSYSQGYVGSIRENVLYGNAVKAIEVAGARTGTSIVGNTILQSGGNAIHVIAQSLGVDFRNNIFSVDNGFVFDFAEDSQTSHTSDYNQYQLGANGKMADFGIRTIEQFSDWFHATMFDPHGISGAPLFTDPDGADDVLGFSRETLGDPIIIDNSDSGFSTTGNWTVAAAGYEGDSLVAGASDDKASWEFVGLTPGDTFTLAATLPYGGYSRAAPFTVLTGGEIVGGPIMFQNFRPLSSADFVEFDTVWTRLGDYVVGADGYLRVELSGGTGSYGYWSNADAIRIQPIIGYGGDDDDFHLSSGSPAIDSGDPNSGAAAEPSPHGSRINRGAYGGTSEATVSANAENVHVLGPNSPYRYNAGQTVSIEWISEVEGAVDIDLFDAASFNPGVSTPVISIAAGLAAAGQWDWTIPDDGTVPTGLEYIIQINAAGGSMPSGISDQSFLIAASGNEYFVNDASQDGDTYSTAIGDNANQGKSPDQPMASLSALMNTYDLGAGDTVFVDSGQYDLFRNIILDERLSGITIKGPGDGTAILDRQSQDGAYVFEFLGADDVTIDGLVITGARVGVFARWDVESHRVTITNNDILDNSSHGVDVAPAPQGVLEMTDWVVSKNRVQGSPVGISMVSQDSQIVGNEVFGNGTGIQSLSSSVLVHDNRVFDNTDYGINAQNGSLVTGNEVFGSSVGIYINRNSNAIDNTVFGNGTGIVLGYNGNPGQGLIQGNRVFANENQGILVHRDGQVIGNYVYSNSIGIMSDDTYLFYGQIDNNLVYANTNQGIVLRHGRERARVVNNTVYQSVGDALRIEELYDYALVRNNILIIDSGTAISVAADSQVGVDLDRNLIQAGTDPNAHVGLWGSTIVDTLAEWQTITSQDANSLTGDPLFLDIDGADNVLGYSSDDGGYDAGQDDNFYRLLRSIAIDHGDSWVALPTDITGAKRSDDPGTVNTGTPAYLETSLDHVALNETGTGDDFSGYQYRGVALPFAFSFYGNDYSTVTVSLDGFLHFDGVYNANLRGDNDLNAFRNNVRIAPLWDDFNHHPSELDYYFDDTVQDQFTVHWNTVTVVDGSDVNFSVTLFADGGIQFDYGSGNSNLTPTVGLSSGNGNSYLLAAWDEFTSVDSLDSLYFETVAGFTDLGAYEFQGNSNDISPPSVIGSTPSGIDDAAAIVGETSSFTIELSEPVNEIDANAPAAYRLLFAGPDDIFGNSDDQLADLTPNYVAGSTTISLASSNALVTGEYRLTLLGQTTLHDLSGLRLDGDDDLVAGGNYVREFTIVEDLPPTAQDQTLTTNEDVEIAITLIGDDGNPQGDQPLLFVITSLPLNGSLAMVAGGTPLLENQLPVLLASTDVYFLPNADSHVTSSFTYVVRDDNGIGEVPERTSVDATITMDVTAVNDAPTMDDASLSLVESAAPNTLVASMSYDDPDLADTVPDTHGFAIIGGNDDLAFSVNGAGEIRLVGQLDYESDATRSLTVQVTDAGGLTGTAMVNVTIVDDMEAQVESTVINQSATNSAIDSTTITFNQIVNFDFSDGGPFELRHIESGDAVTTVVDLSELNGKTIVQLRFVPGAHVNTSGALLDGNYELRILADKVSVQGWALDGDSDGATGDDYLFGSTATDQFFRLFGDADGDRDVDLVDYGQFALTFMKQSGDTGFNQAFDVDGDGDVDGRDFAEFRRRMNRSL